MDVLYCARSRALHNFASRTALDHYMLRCICVGRGRVRHSLEREGELLSFLESEDLRGKGEDSILGCLHVNR